MRDDRLAVSLAKGTRAQGREFQTARCTDCRMSSPLEACAVSSLRQVIDLPDL